MYLNFRPACQLPQTRSAIITALSVQRYLDYLLITLIVYIGNVKTVECFIGIEKHPRTEEKKAGNGSNVGGTGCGKREGTK